MRAQSAGQLIGAAGVAALGVMAGLAIGRARKTAVGAHMALSGDWEKQLKSEHRVVKKLLRAMGDTEVGDGVRRVALLQAVSDALTRHTVEEENVIYPALKSAGADWAARELYAEHAQMKTLISELQDIAPDDPLWLEGAKALKKVTYDHIRDEEENLFPLLHMQEPEARNARLTRLMAKEGLRVTG